MPRNTNSRSRQQQDRGIDYWIRQQEKFMAERGTTYAGYLDFYTNLGETNFDRIRDIYYADAARLSELKLQKAIRP